MYLQNTQKKSLRLLCLSLILVLFSSKLLADLNPANVADVSATAVDSVSMDSVQQSVLNADDEIQINKDKKLFEIAISLGQKGEWAQAEKIYRGLLARHKQWPEPRNNLAIILLYAQRVDEAKQLFEQAVVSSISFRVAQQNRSRLYEYLASQAYDKALGNDTSMAMPHFELIQKINLAVKIIEKEVIVEKIIFLEAENKANGISENIQQGIAKENIAVDLPIEAMPENLSENRSEKEATVTESSLGSGQQENLNSTVKSKPEALNNAANKISEVIKRQLGDWSNAWSRGDFDAYIQHYADDFVPYDGAKSYRHWKNNRRLKLKFTKNVKLSIQQLQVYIEAESAFALVEFVQNYESASYHDQVLKQLYMKKQNEHWFILSERIIKTF